MTVEAMLRLIGGAFVVVSVLLGIFVDVRFLWFTLFVGANLFQSGFTGWRFRILHCSLRSQARR